MKVNITLFTLLLVCTYLNAQSLHCDGSRYNEQVFDNVTETLDIKFGENISVAGEATELFVDVFEPTDDVFTERPFILLLHGGAYVAGEKESLHDICRDYAKRGYVAATMSYRLYDGPLLPLPDSIDLVEVVVQSVEDTYAGLRFFTDDAKTDNTFGIDPDMFFVGGVSAGGITAVHTAYMDEGDDIPEFMANFINPDYGLGGNSNDLTDVSVEVQGVLNFSGAIYNTSWMDENDEPIFSAHDDGDNVVPYGVGFATPFFSIPLVSLQGSETIESRATELDIENVLITFEDSDGHVSYFDDLGSDAGIQVMNGSSTFLEGIVCDGISSVNESLGLETFKAYPNPATNIIQVSFDESIGLEYIEVYNQFGQMIYQLKVNVSNIILSKEDIGKGLFIIKGRNTEGLEIISPTKIIMN